MQHAFSGLDAQQLNSPTAELPMQSLRAPNEREVEHEHFQVKLRCVSQGGNCQNAL